MIGLTKGYHLRLSSFSLLYYPHCMSFTSSVFVSLKSFPHFTLFQNGWTPLMMGVIADQPAFVTYLLTSFPSTINVNALDTTVITSISCFSFSSHLFSSRLVSSLLTCLFLRKSQRCIGLVISVMLE
jgi:hypothetical protein